MKDHIKVLTTLSLAASDTREDTLKSIIISLLLENPNCQTKNLKELIEKTYGFQPYQEELSQVVRSLENEGEVSVKIDQISLSKEARIKYGALEVSLRDKEKTRLENFTNFILSNNENVHPTKIKLLWDAFLEYLYNNFYDYGEDALKRLHPHISFEESFEKEDSYMQIARKRLKDKELLDLFKLTINSFADFATSEDLDFLTELTQKTLSFTSLGIDPELAQTSIDLSLVDWVLYLDTNVLYSILNLHANFENSACVALIDLINNNREYLKIKIRYSDITKKELNSKRSHFDRLDSKLSSSAIRGILKADDLDDFTRKYYQDLLVNPSTLHPSEKIAISAKLLQKRGIDIGRNSKRVEQIGEDYLNSQIQDYSRYINEKNRRKEEFCNDKKIAFRPIFRSDSQMNHDITLRELLINQRSSIMTKKRDQQVSFNSIKYFGVTLDTTLRTYDTYKTKDYDDEQSFPVFFRPSFLLNQLVKVLPIQTDDHKKAFIKAVASRGFNTDVRKSHDILKIAQYLKSEGIDDEEIISNLVTEKIFLEKYRSSRSSDDFNEKEFFESEINRELKRRKTELEKVKQELDIQKDENLKVYKSHLNLESKKSNLEKELQLYLKAADKLKTQVESLEEDLALKRIEHSQSKFDFEGAESQRKIDALKKKYISSIEKEIQSYKKSEINKWKRKIWWHLLWVLPISFGIIYFILFPEILSGPKIDKSSIRVLSGFLALVPLGFFLKVYYARYYDEGNISKKYENINIPEHLKEKLEDLD